MSSILKHKCKTCCFCNETTCADSAPTVIRSCTGRRSILTKFNAAGTLDATFSESASFDDEGGALGHSSFNATVTIEFDLASLTEVPPAGYAGTGSVDGTRADNPLSPGSDSDTLAPFGTATIEVDGSASITSEDEDLNGSGSLTVTLKKVAITVGESITLTDGYVPAGTVTGAARIEFFAKLELSLGADYTAQFVLGGTVNVPLTGPTIDVAAFCNRYTATASDDGNEQAVTMNGGLAEVGNDGSGDGGIFIFDPEAEKSHELHVGTNLTHETAVAQADSPFDASACARALTLNALADFPQNDGTSYRRTIVGRLTMPAVGRCGQYFNHWTGYGSTTDNTSTDSSRPLALSLDLGAYAFGSSEYRGKLNATVALFPIRVDTSVAATDPTNPLKIYFKLAAGNLTANISSSSPTAADIRAALEAILPTEVVRVYRATSQESTDHPNWRIFFVSVAGPGFGPTTVAPAVTVWSGPAIVLSASYYMNPTVAVVPYRSTSKCPGVGTTVLTENHQFTFLAGGAYEALGNGPAATLTVSAAARVDGDPTYFCDAGANCPTAPTAMTLTVTSPAVGVHPAISETIVILKTSSTPCEYAVTWIAASGPGMGANMSATIAVNARGQYALTLQDAGGILLAQFEGFFVAGLALPTITWKQLSRLWTFVYYPDLAVTTS